MTVTIDERLEPEESTPAADDPRTTRRLLWFSATLVALVLAAMFVVEPVRVRSTSMQPTLRSGAVVLIDKVTLRLRDPRRGEVVVTHDPRTGESIVKRVVAVAGDSVGIDNGSLTINGSPVRESYVDNSGMEGFYFGPIVVPHGRVFLLGDGRADSIDSRSFGPVAIGDIDGRVMTTIWPFG